MPTDAPLTAAELAAIAARQQHAVAHTDLLTAVAIVHQDVPRLLAEVERLRADTRPHVAIEPCCMFGAPHIWGHRLTTAQFADLWWGGWTLEEIGHNWAITRGDLLTAWWYAARYGARTWRTRWGAWAAASFDALWHQDWEACPLPPQKRST